MSSPRPIDARDVAPKPQDTQQDQEQVSTLAADTFRKLEDQAASERGDKTEAVSSTRKRLHVWLASVVARSVKLLHAGR